MESCRSPFPFKNICGQKEKCNEVDTWMHRQAHTSRSLLTFAWDVAVHLEGPRKTTPTLPKAKDATMSHMLKPHTDCTQRKEQGFHHQHHLKADPIIVMERTLVYSVNSKTRICSRKKLQNPNQKRVKEGRKGCEEMSCPRACPGQ